VSESLFHASWYRVAGLRPSVRSHAQFHRHHYRGQLWYVLQDHSTGRAHRLTPSAYHLAGLMDGTRTAHEIWEAANTRLGDEGPTQGETIRLLGLLHGADLLRCDISPDTDELLRRSRRREVAEWWRPILNPLSVRIPLVDPDAFLERWAPLVRPLFSVPGAVLWALAVVAAAIAALIHWPELSAGGTAQLLDPRNLLVLWFVYPAVKLVHELGHAFATKIWGGEVHEMGIVFLVLMPVPYVEASAASVFPEKSRRIVVGGAGMMVELFASALALVLWLNVEDGWVRMIAYDVIWIGAASTLLFNGNPLLRFDGYYMLADAIEIPNLSARSRQYLAYLVMKRLFGMPDARDPVNAPGEARWFIGYGLASFLYQFVIMFGIALFIAGRFFVLGVLLAIFAVVMSIGVPLFRQLSFLLTSPRIAEQRGRAIAIVGGAAVTAAVLVLLVPVPLMTRADGIVWPPEGAHVRARADGFVVQVLAESGDAVERGDPIVLTRDPTLEAELAVREAELRELRARHHSQEQRDRVRAQITREEIATAKASLARARERVGDVIIRSPTDGRFVAPQASADLVGRFLKQGQLVGYVVGDSVPTARVVVPQSDIALVRERTRSVELRLSERPAHPLRSSIQREVPAATHRLPSAALGTRAGGRVAVDPMDADGVNTLERVFQLDVALPAEAGAHRIGGRVHVRFHHGSEPIAARVYRALRRVFLRRLGV